MTEELVDIIETDNLTGNDRTMWQHVRVTRGQAESSIEWMKKNITNRYSYEIVPTGTGPK
jgi:hypothetical protein